MTPFLSRFKKPGFGQTCDGCGYCCAVEPCGLAQSTLQAPAHGVCPALEADTQTGGTCCGMVVRPFFHIAKALGKDFAADFDAAQLAQERELSAHVAQALGVGRGCDSSDSEESNHWPWPIHLMKAVSHADMQATM